MKSTFTVFVISILIELAQTTILYIKQETAVLKEAEMLAKVDARSAADCIQICETKPGCSLISFNEQFKFCRVFELMCGVYLKKATEKRKSYGKEMVYKSQITNEAGFNGTLQVDTATVEVNGYHDGRTAAETSAVNLFDGLKTSAECDGSNGPLRMLMTNKIPAPWVRFELEELGFIKMVKIYNRLGFGQNFAENIEVRISINSDDLTLDESLCHYHAGQIDDIAELECSNVMYGKTLLIIQNNDERMNLLEVEVVGCNVNTSSSIQYP